VTFRNFLLLLLQFALLLLPHLYVITCLFCHLLHLVLLQLSRQPFLLQPVVHQLSLQLVESAELLVEVFQLLLTLLFLLSDTVHLAVQQWAFIKLSFKQLGGFAR
jgi:hypothetical protein